MKILIISPHFPPLVGGVADYTFHLSVALSQQGTDVTVLTSCNENVKTCKEVTVLPLIRIWNFLSIARIIRIVRRICPTVIVFQYVPYMYSRWGVPLHIAFLMLALRLMRFSLITTFHEVFVGLEFKKPKYWSISILQKLIAYTIGIASEKVIVSIEIYKKMLSAFDKKIYKIPIGSNILPIHISDYEKRELRKQIASSEEIIISTFGSSPRRNNLLLKVVEKLKEENFPVKFLIIGGFPKDWIEAVKIRIKELELDGQVYFTGFLKSEDVYRYLSISDLFVILEKADNGGMGGISMKNTSLAAAFAAGLPIIGNRGHMTDDFFRHREDIILINFLNEETVSNEIKELIANPNLMEKLRRGAAKTFETKLSWSVIAKKYIDVCTG